MRDSSSRSFSIRCSRSAGRPVLAPKTGHERGAVLITVHGPAAQQPLAGPLVHEVAEVLRAPDLGIVVVVEVHPPVYVRSEPPLVQVEHEVDVVPLTAHVRL